MHESWYALLYMYMYPCTVILEMHCTYLYVPICTSVIPDPQSRVHVCFTSDSTRKNKTHNFNISFSQVILYFRWHLFLVRFWYTNPKYWIYVNAVVRVRASTCIYVCTCTSCTLKSTVRSACKMYFVRCTVKKCMECT